MNYTAIKNKRPKYDKKWFAAFHSFDFPNVNLLFLTNQEANRRQKELFISGKIRNPHFTYTFPTDGGEVSSVEKALTSFTRTIRREEKNPHVRKAYLDRVETRRHFLKLAEASIKGDDAVFFRYSKLLHPAPTKTEYRLAKRAVLHRIIDVKGVRQQQRLVKLKRYFKKFESSGQIINEPAWEKVRLDQCERAELLTSLVQKKEYLTDRQIKNCFDKVLSYMKITGWKVVIERQADRAGISVNRSLKRINIPVGRQVKQRRLMSLVLHEIGTHVLRAHNGFNSQLELLGSGLSHMMVAEEGIAGVRHLSQKDTLSILPGDMYILLLGLALGYEGKKHDFRDIYEFLLEYYELRRLIKKEDIDKDWPSSMAYKQTHRIFRGTSGQTVGVCYTSDVVYFRGFRKIFNYMLRHPEKKDEFYNLGKFDPTNKRHINILKGLNLLIGVQ